MSRILRPASLLMLPASTLPSQVATLGYKLEAEPDGQRLLAAAITETVLLDGTSAPITVTHAGIVRVLRYTFSVS